MLKENKEVDSVHKKKNYKEDNHNVYNKNNNAKKDKKKQNNLYDQRHGHEHDHGHEHEHEHDHGHYHGQEHNHLEDENTNNIEIKVSNFEKTLVDNEVSGNKIITRPRTNTFNVSKLKANKYKKNIYGVGKNIIGIKNRNNEVCNQGHLHQNNSDSDIEEETMKNVVSSKGKFLSLLQARNLRKIFF